jgi:hypothetical protein
MNKIKLKEKYNSYMKKPDSVEATNDKVSSPSKIMKEFDTIFETESVVRNLSEHEKIMEEFDRVFGKKTYYTKY